MPVNEELVWFITSLLNYKVGGLFSTCADLTSALLYLALVVEQLRPFILKTRIVVTFSSAFIPETPTQTPVSVKKVFLGCGFDATDLCVEPQTQSLSLFPFVLFRCHFTPLSTFYLLYYQDLPHSCC